MVTVQPCKDSDMTGKKCFHIGAAFAKLHYVAVHKALKDRAKVPTDANTPIWKSFFPSPDTSL